MCKAAHTHTHLDDVAEVDDVQGVVQVLGGGRVDGEDAVPPEVPPAGMGVCGGVGLWMRMNRSRAIKQPTQQTQTHRLAVSSGGMVHSCPTRRSRASSSAVAAGTGEEALPLPFPAAWDRGGSGGRMAGPSTS